MTTVFGLPGDVPVVGDWDGRGKTKIGVFRNGQWILDTNDDGLLDSGDRVVPAFGTNGDVPVAGNWTGSGALDSPRFPRPR
ncbi:MAG: hypothetical protein ACRD8O_04055 [Bryobacteraceae bacterium]